MARKRAARKNASAGGEGSQPLLDQLDAPITDPAIVDLVKKLQRTQRRAFKAFDQCDELLAELMPLLPIDPTTGRSQPVEFGDKNGPFHLVDNFIDPKTGNPRNKAFKSAGVNRIAAMFSRPKRAGRRP